MDREMIVDPHSSMWESDLVLVVHDISDEYSRDKIDKEVLKCLFAHPEKEAILILNKTDKLKNKKTLLDLVVDLTGGYLNGKEFISKEKQAMISKFKRKRNILRDYDFATLFAKTADKMNLKLLENGKNVSKKNQQVLKLLEELKTCEEYLLKNLKKINIDDQNFEEENSNQLLPEKERISLEKLSDDYIPLKPLSADKTIESSNKDVSLISSIVKDELENNKVGPIIRRIEDISPFDFKKDLLETTDWHLYYKKLSSLGVLVREKTYWPYFNQVFMVSARTNDGVDDLKRYLFTRAKPNNWIFTRNLLTDQMPQDIAEMCVREKMLEHLPDEVPYEVGLNVAFWEIDECDSLNVVVNIIPGGAKGNFKRHLVTFI
jgi:GTPase Era involved in 16S rRNA processing